MAMTYHGILDRDSPVRENFYRVFRCGSRHVVVSEHGSWVALSGCEHALLKAGRTAERPKLHSMLKEKGILLSSDNSFQALNDYALRKLHLFQGTSLHIVVPTLRCNQRCSYCQIESRPCSEKGLDMDDETASKTVDFIFGSPSKNITIEFQGGEPLLNFGTVRDITELAKKRNEPEKRDLRLAIVTNLTLMDDEKLEFLVSNGFGICTSFDGPKLLHDSNRKHLSGAGTYDDVTRWISKIKGYGKGARLSALTTVTKLSLAHCEEIVDEFVRFGFDRVHLRPVNRLGYARQAWDEIGYSADEYLGFWKRSVDYIVGLNEKGTAISERMVLILLKKVLGKADPFFSDLESPCGAVIGQLAYDQKGDIFCCDEARPYEIFRLGNVKQDTHTGIVSSQKARAIMSATTNDVYLCDNCAFKPYCGVCAVCSYVSQGSIIGKLPGDFRCKVLHGQFSYIFEKLLFSERHRNVFLRWLKAPI